MEDVENLLESYFILIDRTFDRLMSLGAARAPNIVPGCCLPIPTKRFQAHPTLMRVLLLFYFS